MPSSDSTTVMLLPTSPRPPSGMTRVVPEGTAYARAAEGAHLLERLDRRLLVLGGLD